VTEVRVRGLASAGAEVAVGDGSPAAARASFAAARTGAGTDLVLSYSGRTVRFAYAADGKGTWLGREGEVWAIADAPPLSLRGARAGNADGTVRSPMPGTVLAVHVSLGQAVTAGQPVLVVEAMKMEHTVTAPYDGLISELPVKPGQQVDIAAVLAVVTEAAV
jgi:acetyl-CoA/propionyl-CoA carboxylase biotin carboxyl carrier protein